MGALVRMIHADALVATVPSRSPLFIYIPDIYSSLQLPVQNRPKMDPFVVGTSLQVRATSGLLFGLIDTMGAPWILVRSRRSYAPLGRPAALGLR